MAVCQKIRRLEIDEHLPKRVVDIKHELFGLNLLTLSRINDRVLEYDPLKDERFKEI